MRWSFLARRLKPKRIQAQERAKATNPEAVALREESQTKYESLDAEQAVTVASEAFPAAIGHPAGGPPLLPAGQTIVGYPTVDAAQVDLGEGKHGVIESLEPIAIESSPGHREPIDLTLTEAAGSVQPARPDVSLQIPTRLADGVHLSNTGVSLTPVDPSGVALGGATGKVVDGATVLYANTQTDADTVVKPVTLGFQEDTLLRSIASPERLSYRVGLPEGASLVTVPGKPEVVQVVEGGRVIATVLPPAAQDAAGVAVPVTLSVSNAIVTVAVAHRSGSYQYPIDIDPTVVEAPPFISEGAWHFYTPFPAAFQDLEYGEHNECHGPYGGGCEDESHGSYSASQWAEFFYETKGASRIYALTASTEQKSGSTFASTLRIQSEAGVEKGPVVLPVTGPEMVWTETTLCVKEGCGAEKVEAKHQANGAYFEQEALNTSSEPFWDRMKKGTVSIEQETGPTVKFNSSVEKVGLAQNALYGNRWVNSTKRLGYVIAAEASDPGLGVNKEHWMSPNAPHWGYLGNEFGNFGHCKGVQCEAFVLWGGQVDPEEAEEHLPDGEDTVEVKVEDPVGLASPAASTKVKVDSTAPRGITLSGLPSTHEISDGQHVVLKASATDGTSPIASSGVASLVLTMDGQQVGTAAKGCAPGECTTTGEWTLSGEAYAAGTYTLAVVATDNAGNVGTSEFQVTIHHAADIPVGPASVSPTTGELALSAADVSLSAPDGGLTVARSYRSRHFASGSEGPLGPQWGMSVGAQESLSRTPNGSMVLTSTNGEQSVFASNGKGGYASPPGDSSLTLSEKTVGVAVDFYLSENGAVTTFAVPSGGGGGLWEPAITEGAGGTNATAFAYKTEGGVTKPTEELAPVPSGVSCSPKLAKGCRALSFVYAEKTKESIGERQSEWGEYKGRLAEVTFTAFDPASKEMKTKAVAQYAYDKQGRLRAEWNPAISPSLKTAYGYDAEGHVTALAVAGQQPWLIEQGTISSDVSPGRALALARPPASTEAALKTEMEAAAPANTAAPSLSSTIPTVGVKISVSSNGTWNNSPLAYNYQWEDCNAAGKECTAIPGAVNQSYYPVAADEGHTLAAEVIALNANGSSTASTAATGKVATGTPNTPLPEPPVVGSLSVLTIDYQVPLSGTGVPQMTATEVAKWGQVDVPAEAAAVFPPDKPMGWPAKEYTRANIYYLDGRDRSVNLSTPTGGISTTEYNLYNDVTRTLTPANRLSAGGSKERAKELDTENTYEETGSEPGTKLLSTLGPKHPVETTNGTKIEEREHTVYSYNEGAPTEGGPYRLVTTMTEAAQLAGKDETTSVRTTKTSYSGQNNLGWKLRKPTSITTDPTGLKLTHSIYYEPKTGNVTESRLPAAGAPGEEQGYSFQFQFGKKGTGSSELKEPQGIVTNASGGEYVLDTGNNLVKKFDAKGTFMGTVGGGGESSLFSPRGIAVDSKGDLWVADTGNNRVVEFGPEGEYLARTVDDVTEPQGVAVDSEGNVWVADTGDNQFGKLICEGSLCYLSSVHGGKGSGETQFNSPQGIAIGAEGNIYITDTGNNRIDEYSKADVHIRNFGSEGTGNGQLKAPHGIATDPAGDVWVADAGNNRIEEFGPTGTFLQTIGKEGTGEKQMKGPQGIAIDGEGNAWVADTGNSRVQEWSPAGSDYGSGGTSAHATQTLYYTAGANTKLATCGEHPEWANLPCQTQPAAQPEGSLPQLQTTTYTYNLWDEPETTKNTSGTTTRTTTATYDPAGRLKSTAVSSTTGTALPTVTEKYSEALGALEEQSTTIEGKTKSIVSHFNTLGQLASYTDAGESTTTYEYDIDGRTKSIDDGKGLETFSYGTTTGLPTELLNEYGGSKLAFTAAYDSEGRMVTEGYPNGMSAKYKYNQVGKPTTLEYEKTTHCTEHCIWFSDSVVPSIHGQWLEQESTFSHQAYAYDAAGRLTQGQNTPVGKGCTTRVYAYDADTNRTSLTTREPGTEGKCATTGGTVEKHTFDTADRLTDAGTSYNTFGDITALPATDAGGKEPSETLNSEYYVDNQLATQKQGAQTIGYTLDPAGRTLETADTGTKTADLTSHYAGPADSPAWTSNAPGGETTRNIFAINGTLAATQSGSEAPVLQLTNLHDDIIATASMSESATELTSKADTSEFGVPTTSLPAKYSWLGAIDLSTELPSGVVAMGARSYVPQIGRFLQPDPIAGGSANAYSYTFGDPIDTTDPSGSSTMPSAWSIETSAQQASESAAARSRRRSRSGPRRRGSLSSPSSRDRRRRSRVGLHLCSGTPIRRRRRMGRMGRRRRV